MSSRSLQFVPKRAYEVMELFYNSYRDRTHLASRIHKDNASAPQIASLPENIEFGSLGHALFLYFATTLTYRADSDVWFAQVKVMYERYPELFSEAVVGVDVNEIQNALVDVGFAFNEQGAGYWKQSGETLYRHFDGNPLALFRFASVDDFLSYKKVLSSQNKGKGALPGIGPKIYSLLAIFLEEAGILTVLPKGAFPVDLHVMRIFIATGGLVGSGKVDAARSVAELLRKRIYERCVRMNYSLQDMAHAFWFQGSKVCWQCNKVQGVELICPAYAACKGSPSTKLYGKKGMWDFDAERIPKGHPQGMLDSPEMVLDRLIYEDYTPPTEEYRRRLEELFFSQIGPSTSHFEDPLEQIDIVDVAEKPT